MEEIRLKYLLKPFAEKTGKQKKLNFEEIDIELYKPSARCVAFKTSKEKILFWVKAIQDQYFDALKDCSEFIVKWIDHVNSKDESQLDDIELKVLRARESLHVENNDAETTDEGQTVDPSNGSLLFTIHVYLTTGVVMCQGIGYEFWAKQEFPRLKEKVEVLFEDRTTGVSDAYEASHEAKITSKQLNAMFTATRSKKAQKVACDKIKGANANEQTTKSISDQAPETPKSHNRKRRNSLDSVRGLSPRNLKSISDLRLIMCNLEAELTEMRNDLATSLQQHEVYNTKISNLEDKLVQQENASKTELKLLASRVVDLEVQNESLKAETTKLKSNIQQLKKYNKNTPTDAKKDAKDKSQQDNQDKTENVEAPETPSAVFDIPSHANQYEALAGNTQPRSSHDEQHKQQPFRQEKTPRGSKGRLNNRSDYYHIVFLADSNAKFIDRSKLCHDREVNYQFSPTIAKTIDIVLSTELDNPTHILIHTGTNDIEHAPIQQCINEYEDLINITAERNPRSRILVSMLIKRTDQFEHLRNQMNAKLRVLPVPPNVHFINNENISEDMLYDNKHVKRRCVGELVRNFKDAIYNRINRKRYPDSPPRLLADTTGPRQHQSIPPSPQPPRLPQPGLSYAEAALSRPSRGPAPPYVNAPAPTYAEVTHGRPVSRGPAPPYISAPPPTHAEDTIHGSHANNTALPDQNILMKLFKIYDMIRQA